MQESYHTQFDSEIRDSFIDHLESTRGLVSSLFTDFRNKIEEFFRARKACGDKAFTSVLIT